MISFMETSWRRVQQLEDMLKNVPGSINSLYWGLTHPTFNDGNPHNCYINPYGIGLMSLSLYVRNGSLDPSTYIGLYPFPSNSPHQDDITCLVKDYKMPIKSNYQPSFATITGWGGTVIESRWHHPYVLVKKDPLLTCLLVFVPVVLTLR